ncbi:unnamed protein product [Auanema sp. JU1783]|nr:unnamed protein product [Auanema sp. JU1783]
MSSRASPQSARSEEYTKDENTARNDNDTFIENEHVLTLESADVMKNLVKTPSVSGVTVESSITIPVPDEQDFVRLFPLGRKKQTIRLKLRELNLNKMLKFEEHQLLKQIYNHIVSFGLREERSKEVYLNTKLRRTASQTLNAASRALLWMFRTKNEKIQQINSVSDICLSSLLKSINDFYFIHLKLYKHGTIVHLLRHIIDFVLLISEIDPLSTNLPQWREQEAMIIGSGMMRYGRCVPEYKQLVNSFEPLKKWLTEQFETDRQCISSDPVLFKQIGVAINLFIVLENGQRAED